MLLNIFRKLAGKEARQFRRLGCAAQAVARADGARTIRGALLDVSQGGCLFTPEAAGFLGAREMEITVGSVTLDCVVLRKGEQGYHCRFRTRLSKGQMKVVTEAVKQARTGTKPVDAEAAAGRATRQTAPATGTSLAEIEARRGRSLAPRDQAAGVE